YLAGTFFGVDVSAQMIYAICGMVAVASPVIGAPLTIVVLVFEMTSSYELTIAALASVALANLVASRFFARSLFDQELAKRGHDLSGGRSQAILQVHGIRELLSEQYVSLRPDTNVGQARNAILEAARARAYLTDDKGHYIGTIHLHEIFPADASESIEDWCDRSALTMREDETIWGAMNAMRRFVGESVAVVDAEGRLVGAIYESDLIGAYLELLAQIRKEEHAAA